MIIKKNKEMSKESSSLLSKIKSKYILQDILSLAYDKIKSVIKLIKYNKNLLNRLDINIKTIQKMQDYKKESEINKRLEKRKKINTFILKMCNIFFESCEIIFLLIYIILFFKNGKLDDAILKKGYNKRKKQFVILIDKYFTIPYLIFSILFETLYTLFFVFKKCVIKRIKKLVFFVIFISIDLICYIIIIIKFVFSKNIIQEDYLKKLKTDKEKKQLDKNILKQLWFYAEDFTIIVILSIKLVTSFIYILIKLRNKIKKNTYFIYDKFFKLKQINGVNIFDYALPSSFEDFDETEKIKFVFNKDHFNLYEYKLSRNQIKLIEKINRIRKLNNIPILEFNEKNKVPDFILNQKTELFFYPNKNLYKYKALNLFIFKYPKNTFNNFIYNEEILRIITSYFLSQINIVEINNMEYTYLYNKNIVPLSIKIKKHKILIDENSSDSELNSTNEIFI